MQYSCKKQQQCVNQQSPPPPPSFAQMLLKFKVSTADTVKPLWWVYSNDLAIGNVFSFICIDALNGSQTLYSHQWPK